MKGLIKWFKSSSKMKRWMLLILVGIMFSCYGIAEILVIEEMSFANAGKVIAIFAVGFIAIVLGLIFLSKRAMELVIESTDARMKYNGKNVNVNSLIFNKTVYDQGPKIVAIGGGTGLDTVLEGLKKYTNNITAIVTLSDYGEEMTESRKKLKLLPLGDIKESIIALSENSEEMEKLFDYKFKDGKLKGLDFSDIFFSAMRETNDEDFAKSIMKCSEVLNISGKVLPVTLDEMKIVAELANGYTVEEKSKIPQMVLEKLTKISRVRLIPSNCKAAPGVIEAIQDADCIVIGPGSLYTNVIPCLLVNGVTKAIKESSAIKIYVSNIMTEIGQTDEFNVSDHLRAIKEHCRQNIIDYCIYDTGEIIPEFIKKYNMEGQDLVHHDTSKIKGVKFIQKDLATVKNEFIRHDPDLVANSIIELVCDDLKYQDKQNDPQYLMLSNKLREEKRINKTKKDGNKKIKKFGKHNTHKDIPKGKSKFSSKYRDRIVSIKKADAKYDPDIQKRILQEISKKAEQTQKEMKKNLEKEKKTKTKTKSKSTKTKTTETKNKEKTETKTKKGGTRMKTNSKTKQANKKGKRSK